MKRHIFKKLLAWKNDPARKPLLIKGVRQCGKTWLLKQFGKEHFTDTAYFNFEGNNPLHNVFASDLSTNRILTELGLLRGRPITLGTTLLIFDEIQFCPNALTSLKYFAEDLPEQHIACAGSLLGIALAKPLSFPVGKVTILTLHPMNFPEFLLANGKDLLCSHLADLHVEDQIPKSILPELKTLYRDYLITGGMPEAVSIWLATHDASRVEETHKQILQSYTLDFAKHAPLKDVPKLSLIWDAIPGQLAKDTGKFVFGHVKSGARAKDLEDALQWLIDAGLVHKIEKIDRPDIPLSAYADATHFKLYLADIGLLRTMSGFPAEALLAANPETSHMRGALTENYVLAELAAQDIGPIFFWKSGNRAEVDFVLQIKTEIIPIEVKSAENTRSKSLARYRELYEPHLSTKISLENLRILRKENGSLLELPLPLVWKMKDFAEDLLTQP
ncbi:ATP-binding protein [Methanorbis rubei]|uniref:ATPase n=1 Tax=Methanorbis rubei TaxID=3028300 RepID=A0AAE4MEJ9_9EURY|nr:hypothetical protein [Methanocorpusculaceae archaeon Cs1]